MIYLCMTFKLKDPSLIIEFSTFTDRVLDAQDEYMALTKSVQVALFTEVERPAEVLMLMEWPSIELHEEWYTNPVTASHMHTLVAYFEEGGGLLTFKYLSIQDQNKATSGSLNILKIQHLEFSRWQVPAGSARLIFEEVFNDVCESHTSLKSLVAVSGFWGESLRKGTKQKLQGVVDLGNFETEETKGADEDVEFFLVARHPNTTEGEQLRERSITTILIKVLASKGLEIPHQLDFYTNTTQLDGW